MECQKTKTPFIACFNGLPGVDCDAAIRRLSGNTQLYIQLVELFFEDDALGRLSGSIGSRDGEAAWRDAHAIKGAAANLGFNGLSSLSGELCASLRAGDWGQSETLFIQLGDAFYAVQKVSTRL